MGSDYGTGSVVSIQRDLGVGCSRRPPLYRLQAQGPTALGLGTVEPAWAGEVAGASSVRLPGGQGMSACACGPVWARVCVHMSVHTCTERGKPTPEGGLEDRAPPPREQGGRLCTHLFNSLP